MTSRRRAVVVMAGLASLACTAACGLVIGLSDHEAYPAEGGTVDAAQETTSSAESGQDATPGSDATDGGTGGDAFEGGGPGCDGSLCADACVDLENDDTNCGGCGITCEASVCYRGTCGGRNVTGLTAGESHACILIRAGEVWCWGAEDQAQVLGATGAASCPEGPCRAPTRIPGLPRTVQVSAGGDQTCALDADGGVWCWGTNAKGGLGHDPTGDPTCATPDASLPCNAQAARVTGLPGPATSVSSGQLGFACAIVGTNVYCWGDDSTAELGPLADGGPSSNPVLVVGNASQLAAGYGHVCALVAGTPACWGSNVSGELGHAPGSGDQTCAGATPCEPTPQTIAVSGATGLHTGFHASCFTSSGVPTCLGADNVAQLGQGTSSAAPNTTPSNVTVLSGVAGLDLGYKTVCAISASHASCWGDDATHQTSAASAASCVGGACQVSAVSVPLGNGNVLETRTSRFSSYAHTNDGKVWAWGANGSGQLGHPAGDGGDVAGCDPGAFPGGTWCNATPTEVVGLP
jgi:hypothetical protein